MAYATQDDIQFAAGGAETLTQLTDQEDGGDIDTDVLTWCITRAEAELNGYLRKRLTVPVDPITEQLRGLAAEATVYYLKRYRRALSQADNDARTAYLDWCRAFAKGEVDLDVDPEPTKSSARIDKATSGRPNPLDVSRKTTRGFW